LRSNQKRSFIGLDLAWKVDGNHSGIAVLVGDTRQVELQAVSDGVESRAGVLEFIGEHAYTNSVLAVDCSLVVRNKTGQRPCETAVAKAFGRYHASCHTTNQGRLYWDTGPNLVQALKRQGFVHDFDLVGAKERPGRWLLEVYPHPAMVRLFGLPHIIKYKKGLVAEKRKGLGELRGHLKKLPGLQSDPKFAELLERDLEALNGKALKRYEDTLDALFCAYLAWYCWKWGEERNEMIGTLENGYIVVPTFVGT
jgi:predicted RNase H-like nuclease